MYKDPRLRRLEEKRAAQLECTLNAPVPETLSFKEKMKKFARESGQINTPKVKSTVSKAQREIDVLSTPPTIATLTSSN